MQCCTIIYYEINHQDWMRVPVVHAKMVAPASTVPMDTHVFVGFPGLERDAKLRHKVNNMLFAFEYVGGWFGSTDISFTCVIGYKL